LINERSIVWPFERVAEPSSCLRSTFCCASNLAPLQRYKRLCYRFNVALIARPYHLLASLFADANLNTLHAQHSEQ
jgi:hypothetical protein